MHVAIVGAGLAGMTAARALHETDVNVTVFEVARGFGGRLDTRRSERGLFDLGAPFFTAREPLFWTAVRGWCERGVAAEWQGRFVESNGGALFERHGEVRYRGVPGMSSICEHLGTGLNVRFERPVRRIERRRDWWHLDNEGRFDAVLVSAPAPHSAGLLAAAPDLARRAREAKMDPCLVVAGLFDGPVHVGFDAAVLRSGPISWLRVDDDKFVIHASSEWSRVHYDEAEPETTAALLEAFRGVVGTDLPDPVRMARHRWRFARTSEPLDEPCLWDSTLRIGACGDWCLGARAESAYLSGVEAADIVVTG